MGRILTGCVIVLAVLVALTGCGSSRPAGAPPAASVAGESISQPLLHQYVTYAVKFYSIGAASPIGSAGTLCRRPSPACTRLQNQVLRRLLEERVVVHYAHAHHIALSASDQRAVDAELAQLRADPTPVGELLARRLMSVQFCRRLLAMEMLVRKVEKAVVPVEAERGFAFHLRSFTIPIAPGGHGVHAYHRAVDLATDGTPIPRNASIRASWIAPSRLAANVRRVISAAQPGDFVGPFRKPGAYLVIQLLGKRVHRYGRPARQHNESVYFRRWLDRQLRAGAPRCFSRAGKERPCP
jgi:predicted small lipoprotein YifL